ncbi:MAG: Asp-tRNA(Asn)/Glu-tRNA(Gln) amidotransferase A subunit family amidase [Paracoccaceae bacterium]|jgi:Asp-tRNA(Asn)/Glu-tRNA(Gln) amidotransferase A subunit family amidase
MTPLPPSLPLQEPNNGAAHTLEEKIALWEPHIHAFSQLCLHEDPEVTTPLGPLAGLTVGIKDIIDVAGLPTRNGSEACRNAQPAAQDAPVVAALRGAGARIIGKTTTTEFAFTDPTPCRNPHDVRRTPGGSSSGSGAAVAAGLVDIALGTQTAGSLCRPAAYCGVVGFKPSFGALPTTGVTPLAPSFDTVGIIATSLALATRAFAAMTPAESVTPKPQEPRTTCGLWDTEATPSDDSLAALHDASSAFSNRTKGSLTADVNRIVAAHRIIMNAEAAAAHGAMLSNESARRLKAKFQAGLRAGAAISRAQITEATDFLASARQAFWADLADVDLIVTLPVPDGPPLIDGTTGYQDWLTPWTVFGGPLLCLPWGVDRLGLPRSVMLAGHPGQDARLLQMGAQLERRSPPLRAPELPR